MAVTAAWLAEWTFTFTPRGADIGTEIQEGEIVPTQIPVPEREQPERPVPERELEEVEAYAADHHS